MLGCETTRKLHLFAEGVSWLREHPAFWSCHSFVSYLFRSSIEIPGLVGVCSAIYVGSLWEFEALFLAAHFIALATYEYTNISVLYIWHWI